MPLLLYLSTKVVYLQGIRRIRHRTNSKNKSMDEKVLKSLYDIKLSIDEIDNLEFQVGFQPVNIFRSKFIEHAEFLNGDDVSFPAA